jgi:hypothetical protein
MPFAATAARRLSPAAPAAPVRAPAPALPGPHPSPPERRQPHASAGQQEPAEPAHDAHPRGRQKAPGTAGKQSVAAVENEGDSHEGEAESGSLGHDVAPGVDELGDEGAEDEAGLTGADSRVIDVPTIFRDFDDYWSPFLGDQGPAPGYRVSLPDDTRAALREKLRTEPPVSPNATVRLEARAFAVRGRRRA